MNGDKRTAGGPKWTKMSKKTNEQKQKEKALASTVAPATAQIKIKEHQPDLSPDEISAINQFPGMLDKKFRDIADAPDFSTKDMFELLYPFISESCHVSRIGADKASGIKDVRHVNLKLMAAMHRVFGISIDELLDDCFQSLPDRQPPKK